MSTLCSKEGLTHIHTCWKHVPVLPGTIFGIFMQRSSRSTLRSTEVLLWGLLWSLLWAYSLLWGLLWAYSEVYPVLYEPTLSTLRSTRSLLPTLRSALGSTLRTTLSLLWHLLWGLLWGLIWAYSETSLTNKQDIRILQLFHHAKIWRLGFSSQGLFAQRQTALFHCRAKTTLLLLNLSFNYPGWVDIWSMDSK